MTSAFASRRVSTTQPRHAKPRSGETSPSQRSVADADPLTSPPRNGSGPGTYLAPFCPEPIVGHARAHLAPPQLRRLRSAGDAQLTRHGNLGGLVKAAWGGSATGLDESPHSASSSSSSSAANGLTDDCVGSGADGVTGSASIREPGAVSELGDGSTSASLLSLATSGLLSPTLPGPPSASPSQTRPPATGALRTPSGSRDEAALSGAWGEAAARLLADADANGKRTRVVQSSIGTVGVQRVPGAAAVDSAFGTTPSSAMASRANATGLETSSNWPGGSLARPAFTIQRSFTARKPVTTGRRQLGRAEQLDSARGRTAQAGQDWWDLPSLGQHDHPRLAGFPQGTGQNPRPGASRHVLRGELGEGRAASSSGAAGTSEGACSAAHSALKSSSGLGQQHQHHRQFLRQIPEQQLGQRFGSSSSSGLKGGASQVLRGGAVSRTGQLRLTGGHVTCYERGMIHASGGEVSYAFYPGSGGCGCLPANVLNAPVQPLWREAGDKGRGQARRLYDKAMRAITEEDPAALLLEGGPTGAGGVPRPPPAAGKHAFVAAMRDRVVPALRAFSPDLIIISAGFDAAKTDVGNSRNDSTQASGSDLMPEDYAEMTRLILSVSRHCCPGRVVSLLEGGYGRWVARQQPRAASAPLPEQRRSRRGKRPPADVPAVEQPEGPCAAAKDAQSSLRAAADSTKVQFCNRKRSPRRGPGGSGSSTSSESPRTPMRDLPPSGRAPRAAAVPLADVAALVGVADEGADVERRASSAAERAVSAANAPQSQRERAAQRRRAGEAMSGVDESAEQSSSDTDTDGDEGDGSGRSKAAPPALAVSSAAAALDSGAALEGGDPAEAGKEPEAPAMTFVLERDVLAQCCAAHLRGLVEGPGTTRSMI